MKRKRLISCLLALALLLPTLLSLGGCAAKNTVVLRVFSWEEYIDEGGEDSYAASEDNPNPLPVIAEFENWYEETYQTPVRVEYSTFGTNEDMYNQLKLGNTYDLVCPSEYMIMKLIAEDMLEPLNEEFFDEENELNYYVNNVSPYIADVFEEERELNGVKHKLATYSAGYMWGTTGLIYNPEAEKDVEQKGWSVLLDPAYKKRVTTKDNVRDSYFVGLAIRYRDDLLKLDKNADNYNSELTKMMNRTDDVAIAEVQKVLLEMKENIFGFETDTGKSDMVKGTISIN
ncbi:MAG: ABC transporter substrate-binding protein, partial [Clostridiales bacterium]|nr:ABC transporter substrate-binding protein [Clostridiales bacterium]